MHAVPKPDSLADGPAPGDITPWTAPLADVGKYGAVRKKKIE